MTGTCFSAFQSADLMREESILISWSYELELESGGFLFFSSSWRVVCISS